MNSIGSRRDERLPRSERSPQDPHPKTSQKNAPTAALGAHPGTCGQRSTRPIPAPSSLRLPSPSAADPPPLRPRRRLPAHHLEPPPPDVRRLEAVAAATAHHGDLMPIASEAPNLRTYPSEPGPRRRYCPTSTDLGATLGAHTLLTVSPQHACGARRRFHRRLERPLTAISRPVARFLAPSARPTTPRPSPEALLPPLAGPHAPCQTAHATFPPGYTRNGTVRD